MRPINSENHTLAHCQLTRTTLSEHSSEKNSGNDSLDSAGPRATKPQIPCSENESGLTAFSHNMVIAGIVTTGAIAEGGGILACVSVP